MTLRRDFLGFTAGAVAAKTVLPLAARAQPSTGTEGITIMVIPSPDAELLACVERFAAADQQQNAAVIRFGEELDRLDLAADEDQRRWDAFLAAVTPSNADLGSGAQAQRRGALTI